MAYERLTQRALEERTIVKKFMSGLDLVCYYLCQPFQNDAERHWNKWLLLAYYPKIIAVAKNILQLVYGSLKNFCTGKSFANARSAPCYRVFFIRVAG